LNLTFTLSYHTCSKKSNRRSGVAFHEHEGSFEVDQLYSAIVNGDASTSDLEDVADISLLWSAIILIVRSTELLMYQRSSIEPSELAVHIQRFIGALFSTFENLLEHQSACTAYLVQSIQSCYSNSFNEKKAASESALIQMMSEYRSLFPYAYMFNRRTGKSPSSQIDKVTERLYPPDPFPAPGNSYTEVPSPIEPADCMRSVSSHHDMVSDSNSELGDSFDNSFDNIGTFLAPMISAPSIMPLKPVKMLSDDEHYGSDYQPAVASDIDSDVYDVKSNFGASNDHDCSRTTGDGTAEESGVSILSSYYKYSGWNTMMEEDEDSDTQDDNCVGDYRPPAAHTRSRRTTRMRSSPATRKARNKSVDNLDEANSEGAARSHTTRIKRSKRKKSLGTAIDGKDVAPVTASTAASLDKPTSSSFTASFPFPVMDVQPFDSTLAMSDMDDIRDISEALIVETLSDDDERTQKVSLIEVHRSASHRASAASGAVALLPNSNNSSQRDHQNEPPISLQTRWGNTASGLEDSSRRPRTSGVKGAIRSRNEDASDAIESSRASKPRIKFRNPLDASLELDNSVEEFTESDGPDDNAYGRKESDINLSQSETDTDPESPSSSGGRADDPFSSPMISIGPDDKMNHASQHRWGKSAVETAQSAATSTYHQPNDLAQHTRTTVVKVPTASPPKRPKYDAPNWDSVPGIGNDETRHGPPTEPSIDLLSDNITATAPIAVTVEEVVEGAQHRRERLHKIRAWIAKRDELKQQTTGDSSRSLSVAESERVLDESNTRRTATGSDDACDHSSAAGTSRRSVSFRDAVISVSQDSISAGMPRDSASSYDAVLYGSRNASFTSKTSNSDVDESEKSSVNLEVRVGSDHESTLVSDPSPSIEEDDDKYRNGDDAIDHHSDAVRTGGSFNDLAQYVMDKPFSYLPTACRLPELSEFAEATGVIMEGFLQKKSSGMLGLWRQVRVLWVMDHTVLHLHPCHRTSIHPCR